MSNAFQRVAKAIATDLSGLSSSEVETLIGLLRKSQPLLLLPNHSITVDYSASVEQLIEAGKYGWSNDDITSHNFPSFERGTAQVVVYLVNFNSDISIVKTLSGNWIVKVCALLRSKSFWLSVLLSLTSSAGTALLLLTPPGATFLAGSTCLFLTAAGGCTVTSASIVGMMIGVWVVSLPLCASKSLSLLASRFNREAFLLCLYLKV